MDFFHKQLTFPLKYPNHHRSNVSHPFDQDFTTSPPCRQPFCPSASIHLDVAPEYFVQATQSHTVHHWSSRSYLSSRASTRYQGGRRMCPVPTAIKVHLAGPKYLDLAPSSTGIPEPHSSSICEYQRPRISSGSALAIRTSRGANAKTDQAASMPGERAAASKKSSKAKYTEPDPYSGPASTAASASADESGAFWAIRGILEEKKVKGRLHYKVDWENHPETGESYVPTWVSPPSQTVLQAGP